jgi:hypothetical protein
MDVSALISYINLSFLLYYNKPLTNNPTKIINNQQVPEITNIIIAPEQEQGIPVPLLYGYESLS